MFEEARLLRIEKIGFLPAFDADQAELGANYGKMAEDGRAYLNSLPDDSD
jgi:hypothetical protein